MPKPPFITRVKLRNYKSIARCDVELGPLGILVGPNGSGKSNFLDALALVSEVLLMPLRTTFRHRGGFGEVIRRSPEKPSSFAIDLRFTLPDKKMQGRYAFEIARGRGRPFVVTSEICKIWPHENPNAPIYFEVRDGEIVGTNVTHQLPRPVSDGLFLTSVTNFDEFRLAFDALFDMDVYKFDLDEIRHSRVPESYDFLMSPDGYNLAGVLGVMEQKDPVIFDRIQRYMRAIVPGFEHVSKLEIPTVNQESMETIQFTQQFGDGNNQQIFTAINMSDGTLRALAVLAALLQGGDTPPPLVGIEEPETALHPAATGVLWDALMDGAERTQVLVTTQSPDLLDRKDVPTDAILAVDMEAGKTEIGPIAESSRTLLQERLATPGELLRQRRLSPSESLIYPQSPIRF